MTARVGVVTFPGSLDDKDAARAVRLAGAEPVPLWHAEADLKGVDAVILPGGFSYGNYLRSGAIARFAPLMAELVPAARSGALPVLGICNGFQILTESGLLPGALIRNSSLRFVNREQALRVESIDTAWTGDYEKAQEILLVLKVVRATTSPTRPPSTSWSPGAGSSPVTSVGTPTGPDAASQA